MNKFFLLIAILFTSCGTTATNSTHNLQENTVINKAGKYFSKQRNVLLDIKTVDGLVRFEVYDSTNKKLVELCNSAIASDYQGWYFMLDTNSNLWFHSSDIGETLMLWQPATHNYLCHPLWPHDSFDKIMPKNFFDAMPSSAQQYHKNQ